MPSYLYLLFSSLCHIALELKWHNTPHRPPTSECHLWNCPNFLLQWPINISASEKQKLCSLCYGPSFSRKFLFLVKPPHWKFSLLVALAQYSWGALNTDSHCANRKQCLCPVTVYLLGPSIISVCCPWIPATQSVERQPRHTALGTVQCESNDDEVEPAASFTIGLEWVLAETLRDRAKNQTIAQIEGTTELVYACEPK